MRTLLEAICLEELHNNGPRIIRFISKDDITMDRIKAYYDSIGDVDWSKDTVTRIDQIDTIDLDRRAE